MAPRSTSRTLRSVCTVTAIGLTTSLGLLVSGGGAHAADTTTWDPADWGMAYLPAPSVDGELSVARISNENRSNSQMVSFTTTGSSVSYNGAPAADFAQWSPGGDVVADHVVGSTTVTSPTPSEPLHRISVAKPSQWSPFGDSTVASLPAGAGGSYVQRATWIGQARSEALTTAQPVDNGAAAPTPWGDALVATVGSPGNRDLAITETYLPRMGNPAMLPGPSALEPLGYSAFDAHDPVVGAEGTLAFVGHSDKGPVLMVDEGNGAESVASLGGDCPGQRPAFSPSGLYLAYLTSSSDCAETTLRYLERANGTFVGGADTVVVASASGDQKTHFEGVSWRAKTPAAESLRLGGSDRVATGIAVSKSGWGPGTGGAVIASSESFPDALVAGPLAGLADMPLLINPKTKLDSRVLAELKRLMPIAADRFVYIVGGTGVVSTTVQKSLSANGFYVVRLAGSDRFATSVAVARQLDEGMESSGLPRSTAFLADGTNFPDALSAGPAASLFLAPTLLSNGRSVPPVVKSYVNGRTAITAVHAVGGNAASAVGTFGSRAGVRVVGSDRYATSAKVAQQWFPGASTVGYASGTSFPDALTGGALMSGLWEPLMLVQAKTAPPTVTAQAYAFRASADQVLTFGGTGVIADPVRTQLAGLAGTQTALYGPTSPVVASPFLSSATALQSPALGAGTDPMTRLDRAGRNPFPEPERPDFRTPRER